MIKLRGFRALLVNLIYLVALLITIGIPFIYLYLKIRDNITVSETIMPSILTSLYAVIGMIIIAVVYSLWIKQWFKDKILAIRITNEIGMYSSTPLIINRLMITISYSYLFVVSLLIFYIFKLLFIQYAIFVTLYKLNILLLIVLGVGSIIFFIGDILKISMMNAQKIEDDLAGEIKKDKLYLKRVKQNKRVELEAIHIQRELDAIKKGNSD